MSAGLIGITELAKKLKKSKPNTYKLLREGCLPVPGYLGYQPRWSENHIDRLIESGEIFAPPGTYPSTTKNSKYATKQATSPKGKRSAKLHVKKDVRLAPDQSNEANQLVENFKNSYISHELIIRNDYITVPIRPCSPSEALCGANFSTDVSKFSF